MNRQRIQENLTLPLLLARMSRINRGVEPSHSLSFGPDPNQAVLIYTPPPDVPQREALIYFVHGGGWRTGNPRDYRFIGKFFAERGLHVAMPGFRHAPRATWPAQRDDVFNGFRHTLRFAKDLGIGTKKVFVAGQSGGAQLASLLLLDREAQAAQKLDPARITGLISISGPLDFGACTDKSMQKLIRGMMGGDAGWEKADPIRLLDDSWTWPVLCIHGDQDTLVHPRASANFAEKVNQIRLGRASLYFKEGLGHTDMATLFLDDLPTTRALVGWLDMLLL